MVYLTPILIFVLIVVNAFLFFKLEEANSKVEELNYRTTQVLKTLKTMDRYIKKKQKVKYVYRTKRAFIRKHKGNTVKFKSIFHK